MDSRTADPRLQQSAGDEVDIANGFRADAKAVLPPEQLVRQLGVRVDRGLLVGRGEHDGSDQFFAAPTEVAILRGEPVEKLRMRRTGAVRSEIVRCGHDSDAEELLPDSVRGNARGERISFVKKPVGQREPIGILSDAERMKYRRRGGRDRIALIGVVAANVNEALAAVGCSALDKRLRFRRRRCGRTREMLLDWQSQSRKLRINSPRQRFKGSGSVVTDNRKCRIELPVPCFCPIENLTRLPAGISAGSANWNTAVCG